MIGSDRIESDRSRIGIAIGVGVDRAAGVFDGLPFATKNRSLLPAERAAITPRII
jgi:hypothetical protein